MRRLAGCAACAEEIDAGRAPPSRRVIVDGRSQPYWRSPAHAGYFGSGSTTLNELLVQGGTLSLDAGIGLLDVSWGDLL